MIIGFAYASSCVHIFVYEKLYYPNQKKTWKNTITCIIFETSDVAEQKSTDLLLKIPILQTILPCQNNTYPKTLWTSVTNAAK